MPFKILQSSFIHGICFLVFLGFCDLLKLAFPILLSAIFSKIFLNLETATGTVILSKSLSSSFKWFVMSTLFSDSFILSLLVLS